MKNNDSELETIQVGEKDPRSIMTRPLSDRGFPRSLVILSSIVGFVYLLNPTAGVLEFLPDNLPIIGNLDEGGAFILLWYGLLEIVERRRSRRN